MNFLAHFHLAGDTDGMRVGALLGDFVKGPLTKQRINTLALPADIVQGIKLHRQIDSYVDQHPTLLSLGNQLTPELRRYKGIVLDLFCDYALSHHWRQLDSRALTDYTAEILSVLKQHQQHMSGDARQLYRHMEQYDLLNNYSRRETIDAIIVRIGERINRVDEFRLASEQMWQLAPLWLNEFIAIYRDIQQFAGSQRAALILL